MIALVDYNNLDRLATHKGPTYVCDLILNALGYKYLKTVNRLHIRLYDGWYERQSLTRKAQAVAQEIGGQFPCVWTAKDPSGSCRLRVNAEAAYSLLSDPGTHLWHTFRKRQIPRNIVFEHPNSVGCADHLCPLHAMYSFFLANSCPKSGCAVRPSDLLRRNEQKLVDAMLFCDLVSLHLQSQREAVLVSSDDDLWPSIKLVLSLGMKVIHIHTQKGRLTPQDYSRGVGNNYHQLFL